MKIVAVFAVGGAVGNGLLGLTNISFYTANGMWLALWAMAYLIGLFVAIERGR